MPTTAVTGLRCIACGKAAAFDASAYLCAVCGEQGVGGDPGILDVEYDYDMARRRLDDLPKDAGGLSRFLPLLPLASAARVLPVGGTALVPAPRLARRLGLRALHLKDETRNPTRCLKDRSTAIGVSLALERGIATVYCASAGNAAISLAGFAAHAGLACHVFVPGRVSEVRLDWLRRFGAQVHVSEGNYDQAFAESERAGRDGGWYSRNCAYNPFLVEGKKTVALEIGAQLGFEVPDAVIAPVGDGCTLAAIGKGFRELREIGRTGRVPALIGVQADGVQPLVRRFRSEPPGVEGETRAASISVRRPRNARRLLRELGIAGGELLAVPDEATALAQKELAVEAGLVAEFTSATTLAALAERAGALRGQRVVLVITGGRADA